MGKLQGFKVAFRFPGLQVQWVIFCFAVQKYALYGLPNAFLNLSSL